MRRLTRALLPALALLLGAFVSTRAQGEPAPTPAAVDEKLERILEKAGEAVARYQSGLFSITFTEVLRDEELSKEMTPKKSKEFVFETVVLRESLSENEGDFYPKSVRRLKTVDGKPAKKNRRAPWYGYNVQSLGLLLPKYRKMYEFTLEGEEAIGGRAAHRVRVFQPGQPPASVDWKRGALGVGMRFWPKAPTYALIWLDAENSDVLRLETHLVAPFEFDSPRLFGAFGPSRHLKWVNQDYAVTFRRHTFKDPEQTLLVPDAAEWLTVIDGAQRPRLRASLRFSNYQRFRSDVKIIDEPDN
jgi:hypothetical protein